MGGFSKTKMISMLSYAKFQSRINQRWSCLIILKKRVYASWTFTQNLFSFPIVLFIAFFYQHLLSFQLLVQLARNYSYFVQTWENNKQINLLILNSYFQFRSSRLNGDIETTSASSSNYTKLNGRYQLSKS